MAFVDTETKKIYGAKKGSLTYFHEVGHLAFIKKSNRIKIRAGQELNKDMLLIFLGFGFFFGGIIPGLFIFWFLIRWLIYYTFEEIWCWIYAFKRKRLEGGAQEI